MSSPDQPATAAWKQRVYDSCFAAGWATTGVILGAAGGWWSLLWGPVIVAATLMGAARYGGVRRGR